MIRFVTGPLRADPPNLRNAADLVANVEAKFQVLVGQRVLYEEVGFPVVELAAAARRWQRAAAAAGENFEFDSMSAEAPGLVWFRHEDDGWRIGSTDQTYPEISRFSSADIDAAIATFVTDIAQRIEDRFGRAWVAEFRRLADR